MTTTPNQKTVTITADDAAQGVPRGGLDCPLAMAIIREFAPGLRRAQVNVRHTRTEVAADRLDNSKAAIIDHGPQLQRWIREFDCQQRPPTPAVIVLTADADRSEGDRYFAELTSRPARR